MWIREEPTDTSAPVMIQSGCSLSLLTSDVPQIDTIPSSFFAQMRQFFTQESS